MNEVKPVPPPVVGNVPLLSALVDDAKMAVPEVNAVRPVPPLVVAKVPASVIAPVVAVLGVNPVVPAENESTGADVAFEANNLTVPAAFLKYNFSSWMLIANSPLARFPDVGVAAAVVL